MKSRLWLGAFLFLSTAASAEGWHKTDERLEVPEAGISVPARVGTLALTQTGEAGSQGDGIDNYAQYESSDGQVEGTIYVYLPAYADAALAAHETGRVIESRYGPGIRLASSSVVAAGGFERSAIRKIYDNALGGKIVTTAAFARAGHWMVKVRVSGPMARKTEVEQALDAFLSGLAVSDKSRLAPASDLQVTECPAKPKKAKPVSIGADIPELRGNPLAQALVGATLASGDVGKDKPEFPVTIAENGARPLCVRERVASGEFDIPLMQPSGETDRPSTVIALVDDAGGVVEMRKAPDSDRYLVFVHQMGRTLNLGFYDRPLTGEQVRIVLSGQKPGSLVQSVTVYKADGNIDRQIIVSESAVK